MLISLFDMNNRLGFGPGYGLLWTASCTDVLGVPPSVQRGPENLWTEEQYAEICRRLAKRLLDEVQRIEDDL